MKFMIFLIVRVVGHHLAWFSYNLDNWGVEGSGRTRTKHQLQNSFYTVTYIRFDIQSNVKSIVSFIHRAVERIFAKTGNSLNVVKDDGFTTLHIAAINDHREIAKILLTKVIYKKKSTDFSLFFVNCNLYFFLASKTPCVVKPP